MTYAYPVCVNCCDGTLFRGWIEGILFMVSNYMPSVLKQTKWLKIIEEHFFQVCIWEHA